MELHCEKNEISYILESGLHEWKRDSSHTVFLEEEGLKIPRIWAPTLRKVGSPLTIILAAGLHLEETSGSHLLLSPSLFRETRGKGFNLLIYPVINQSGLKYPREADEKLLRYSRGYNLNTGWGLSCPKAPEVAIVEKDLKTFVSSARKKPILFISLHEDSEYPPRGYIFTNGLSAEKIRALSQRIEQKIAKSMLAKASELPYKGTGSVQKGYIIAEDQDPGSMENWINDSFGIPAILIEAPYGASLQDRISFHQNLINAAIKIISS